ncbi:TetR/AcrR family transcriptional regulator [Amphibacillus cookii]|uniref:TetR/AcrR family transcriptional regulator n=1 Tax=Amphibacillus cookii TaxID=767787 RepID=UPI00195A7B41|nr:TetR/AcrR family transcriptional regulator [Amphibacillus cookii]MBM7540239.1 AcrR family transcriptional regulator [Amphibacillus cookii]
MSPRGFSEQERERIDQALKKTGRHLFETVGINKTSIKDLTDQTGIAQGSFYKFFSSKEHLYFSLLEEDEQAIHDKLADEFARTPVINQQAFCTLLKTGIDLIEGYPLVKQILLTDQFQALVSRLPSEVLTEHFQKDSMFFARVFEQWKNDNLIDRQLTTNVIAAAMRSIVILLAHKREIGEAVFDEVLNLLIEGLASRLFTTDNRS